MTDVWPVGLPQYLQMAGASKGMGNGLLEYAPEVGPSITRRRTTARMRPISGSMICSSAQITTFETFYNTTIIGGSLPFNFPDPRTGSTLLVKFTAENPPNYTPLGGDNYQLALVLMELP